MQLQEFRIGIGYDVHQFVKGQKLILGGVEIQHPFGLLGYSDADVLIHAVADAVLGAMAERDIGIHFPSGNPDFKDISGTSLLTHVRELMERNRYAINNLDVTVVAQKPKIAEYISQMRKNLSLVLNTKFENVSVKATTTDKLGFTGRSEGIAVEAIVMLYKIK